MINKLQNSNNQNAHNSDSMLIDRLKKITFLFLFILQLSSTAVAQNNLPYVDDKLIHFGFTLGMNTMDFGVTQSNSNKYQVEVSDLQPGFSVGIISDLRLYRYLNLRVTPTLHFAERKLTYKNRLTGIETINSIVSIPMCLPVHLKYSAERIGNYRPYLIGGGGAYIDLGRKKDAPVLLKPIDFYAEFGVGCDIYFSFFKLAPELKFAIGLNDMFTPLDQRDSGDMSDENKEFSLALKKLTSRMLTLTFNFE